MYYQNPEATLIVVYKDELLVNQLKKLIETKDDENDGKIVGTTDGSVNVIAWTEKFWLEQKKAGNITSKILFLGDIKGTEKLLPVIDVKFNEFGITYGWAGKQAVLTADLKTIKSQKEYASFIRKMNQLPVPPHLKKAIKSTGIHTSKTNKTKGKFDLIGMLVSARDNLADVLKVIFSDKKLLLQQLLIYGIITLYNNDLETFICS